MAAQHEELHRQFAALVERLDADKAPGTVPSARPTT
jgi:hypothetical protein